MIIDIAKLEGVKQKGAGSFLARCPQCAIEGRDSQSNHLSILADGTYNCIANSDHNKDIFKLVGLEQGSEIEFIPQEPKVELPKRWPLSTLDRLIHDYSYWESRGISGAIVEKFCGGVAVHGEFKDRFVIPIFNKEKNEIVGFTGRTLKNKNPKWLHSKGKKSEWIWPLDINSIKQKGYILLVESPACVFSLANRALYNSLCLFGTMISDAQIAYLISICPDKIFVGTNNEPQNQNIGNMAAEKIKDKLLKFFNEDQIKITLPEKKDFCDMIDENDWKIWSEKYE